MMSYKPNNSLIIIIILILTTNTIAIREDHQDENNNFFLSQILKNLCNFNNYYYSSNNNLTNFDFAIISPHLYGPSVDGDEGEEFDDVLLKVNCGLPKGPLGETTKMENSWFFGNDTTEYSSSSSSSRTLIISYGVSQNHFIFSDDNNIFSKFSSWTTMTVAVSLVHNLNLTQSTDQGVANSDSNGRRKRQRKNLLGHVIRVIAQEDEDYTAAIDMVTVNGTTILRSGSVLRILLDLQKLLNFSFDAVNGKGWISKKNFGIGQQLIDDEGDLIISFCSIYEYRAILLHFLPPVRYTRGTIYYQQPSLTSAKNIFVMPFQPTAWLFFGVLWLLVLTLTTCCTLHYQKPHHFGDMLQLFSDQMVCTMSAISLQGWSTLDPSQTSWSIRLICLTSMILSLLTYALYSASFLGSISARTFYIRKFEDFEVYGYQLFTNPNHFEYPSDFMLTTESQEKLQRNSKKVFKSHGDAISKVLEKESKYGFIVGSDGFFATEIKTNVNPQVLCKVSTIFKEGGRRILEGMVINKGSPLREHFTHATIMLMENGLNKKYEMEYYLKTQVQCLKKMRRSSEEFNFIECLTAFVILFVGQILSIFILCWERWATSDGPTF